MVESVGNNRAAPVNRLADAVAERLGSERLGSERLGKARSISEHRGADAANSAISLSNNFAEQPIDVDHVAAIKAQIDAGTYRVDADQLAKDILSFGGSSPDK